MMKWILTASFLAVLLLISCSKDRQATDEEKATVKSKFVFLTYTEDPSFKIILKDTGGAKDITLQIFNKRGETKSIEVMGNPSESTELQDHFYSNFCGKHMLIAVVRQWINTHESAGWTYYNIIINPEKGELVKILEGDDSEIKIGDEIISYDQSQLAHALKSGNSSSSMCKS